MRFRLALEMPANRWMGARSALVPLNPPEASTVPALATAVLNSVEEASSVAFHVFVVGKWWPLGQFARSATNHDCGCLGLEQCTPIGCHHQLLAGGDAR